MSTMQLRPTCAPGVCGRVDGAVRLMGALALVAALGCGALPQARAQAQEQWACGNLSNGQNGPFDYRTERGRRLAVVEEFHFTTRVENLLGGQSAEIGQDLEYTLRAFPNHHRALLTVQRYAKRSRSDPAPRTSFTVECFYQRALRFQPNDTTARLLYARYLGEAGRLDDAVRQLDYVIEVAADNPFTQYNAGLVFMELGLFDRALKQAHAAQAGGFTKPELRQQLVAKGRWRDPDAGAAAAAAPAPASAASR